MSNTTKFYDLRDRYNRYRKAIKKVFQSKYYTDSSKSQYRKGITENRINNAALVQKNNDTPKGQGVAFTGASSPDPRLHVSHRLDRPYNA